MTDSETTWNYTVQDYSPLFTYASNGNATTSPGTNLNPSWNQTCPFEPSGPLKNYVCDGSSAHWTNKPGARLSLTFYGQSIQLFGNTTAGMVYDVEMDGSVSSGNSTGPILASVSNLTLASHVLVLSLKSSVHGGALFFDKAVVTVGTGLTGADITRTVVQDGDLSISYSSLSWTTQSYDAWDIPHTSQNDTWHQISANHSGSVTAPFTGSAILAYGNGWSFLPSDYQASLDSNTGILFANNSTLPKNSNYVYTSGLLFFQANLTNTRHTLTLANDHGYLGLDYIEIINITGGSPTITSQYSQTPPAVSFSSSHKSAQLGAILGAVFGALVILILLVALLLHQWRRSENREQRQTRPYILTPPVSQLNTGIRVESRTRAVVPDPADPDEITLVPGSMPLSSHKVMGHDRTPHMSLQTMVAPMDNERNAGPSVAEIDSIRRDLQQLLGVVGRPRSSESAPPKYEETSPIEFRVP